MTSAEGEQTPRGDARTPWERPTLTLLGNVKDLIRASGKGSELPEMDPTGRKDRLSG
jgi:hypothetical protein